MWWPPFTLSIAFAVEEVYIPLVEWGKIKVKTARADAQGGRYYEQ